MGRGVGENTGAPVGLPGIAVGAGVAVATALGLIATAPRRVEGLEEALLEDGDDEDESEV